MSGVSFDNTQGLGETLPAQNCHTTKPSALKGLQGEHPGTPSVAGCAGPVDVKLERAAQEPLPGLSLKYFSNLSVSRSNASASAGGSPLTVMFGQILA